MNERTKTGIEILWVAGLIGILGNVLLRETPWGLNASLFVAVFVAAMTMLVVRRKPEFLTRQNIALYGAMVFFAAMFSWRDSEELHVYDTLAILTIMGVLMLPALKLSVQNSGVFHYFAGFVWAGLNSAFGPAAVLASDIEWEDTVKTGWSNHLVSALKGIAIALPILIIFGALFAAADAAFEGMIEGIFNKSAETVFSHLLLTVIFFWLTAGYFRGALFEIGSHKAAAENNGLSINPNSPHSSAFDKVRLEETINADALPGNATILEHINKEDVPQTEQEPQPKKRDWQNFDNSLIPQAFTLGAVETTIVLGLINLLFLSFVIVQVPYLFGGIELVQNTPDFKLAEYARRGFGELVAVAALVLPILLLSHWLLRKDKPENETIFRVLAGIQIVLLFVIMASAAQRLFLLTGNLGYGLTTVRLYPMIFMIWLAVIFVIFGITVLRGARQYFAWAALWSAFFVLAGTHFLNPDEFIVRTNVRLMQQGREFDAFYNSSLSDDAIPALVEGLANMTIEDRCEVGSAVHYRYRQLAQPTDVRSWSLARRAAWTSLRNNHSILHETSGCPEQFHNDKESTIPSE
ncbi:MAG: DUF4173 domain-containing protein [Pyrinomonadaceae bacterium]